MLEKDTATVIRAHLVSLFNIKNAQATFQRLIDSLTVDLVRCKSYIYDGVVYSDTWEQHVHRACTLLERLAEAHFTVNLSKSELGHAQLGYITG